MACSKCRVGFERGKGMECGGIYCAIDAAALFACKTGASVVAAPRGWQAPSRSRCFFLDPALLFLYEGGSNGEGLGGRGRAQQVWAITRR